MESTVNAHQRATKLAQLEYQRHEAIEILIGEGHDDDTAAKVVEEVYSKLGKISHRLEQN